MKFIKKTAVALAMLATAGSSSVFAATTAANIDATAGLQPVLSMTCTPVKFGVWRVPVRSTGGTTTITLSTTSDTAAPSGNTNGGVAMSAAAAFLSARGLCTVVGSTAADATAMTITLTASATSMGSDGASVYTGLGAPTTAATGMSTILSAPSTSAITNSGTTFYVGGTLTIPQTIVAGNYGAYKTTTPVVITVDDLQ